MQKNYKRLGDYIQQVDERNSKLEDLPLMGLSVQKMFISSIANTIGSNMANYKIIYKNQFAYIADTSRRGDKIAVALFKDYDKALISQAYTPFKIIDSNKLLPEYLMMWLMRPEFDRYARYKSHGSVREIFSWEEMCDVMLPIPDIDAQQALVDEYQTIERRIQLNEQLCQKLEETAQTLYRKYFVEDIDTEDLPEGWRWGKIGDEFTITIGRTPPRIEKMWFNIDDKDGIDWISIKDISSNNTFVFNTAEQLTKEALEKFQIPIIPKDTTILSFKMSVGRVAITTKEMLSNEAIAHFNLKKNSFLTTEYIYCFFKNFSFDTLGTTSSIVNSINTNIIKNLNIIIPSKDTMKIFSNLLSIILRNKKHIEYCNIKLKELLSLLLAKMGRKEEKRYE